MGIDHRFLMPKESIFGHGCCRDIGPFLRQNGLTKALVVTDKFLHSSGLVDKALTGLRECNIPYSVFDGVFPNPTTDNVKDGVRVYQESGCDCIVAVGGGSPIDCAKAIGLLAAAKCELEELVGLDKSTVDSVPLVAVNTTAGTASEISRACLIVDKAQNRKIAIKDKRALPILAVNDSELMVTLPAKLTAATGMDALTHAIESYTCTAAYPVSRCAALEAVNLIFDNLKGACQEPENIIFRDNMIYGQFLAGISFCNAGLGLVHAMSHQLSAIYNLPHGLCNAILLPKVMQFHQRFIPTLYDDLCMRHSWNTAQQGLKAGEATDTLIQKVCSLSADIGTTIPLRELKVEKKILP